MGMRMGASMKARMDGRYKAALTGDLVKKKKVGWSRCCFQLRLPYFGLDHCLILNHYLSSINRPLYPFRLRSTGLSSV